MWRSFTWSSSKTAPKLVFAMLSPKYSPPTKSQKLAPEWFRSFFFAALRMKETFFCNNHSFTMLIKTPMNQQRKNPASPSSIVQIVELLERNLKAYIPMHLSEMKRSQYIPLEIASRLRSVLRLTSPRYLFRGRGSFSYTDMKLACNQKRYGGFTFAEVLALALDPPQCFFGERTIFILEKPIFVFAGKSDETTLSVFCFDGWKPEYTERIIPSCIGEADFPEGIAAQALRFDIFKAPDIEAYLPRQYPLRGLALLPAAIVKVEHYWQVASKRG